MQGPSLPTPDENTGCPVLAGSLAFCLCYQPSALVSLVAGLAVGWRVAGRPVYLILCLPFLLPLFGAWDPGRRAHRPGWWPSVCAGPDVHLQCEPDTQCPGLSAVLPTAADPRGTTWLSFPRMQIHPPSPEPWRAARSTAEGRIGLGFALLSFYEGGVHGRDSQDGKLQPGEGRARPD